MKTLDFIIENYKSETLDGRDLNRLAQFVPKDRLTEIGLSLKDENADWNHKELTRENLLEQLKSDVEFGFEKALDKRGLSADMMHSVVQMWNWVLEEGLENFEDYAQYGLPLFKATAVKYGFDNPIGDDEGDEDKYSSEG